jgi:hypothetical protein
MFVDTRAAINVLRGGLEGSRTPEPLYNSKRACFSGSYEYKVSCVQ